MVTKPEIRKRRIFYIILIAVIIFLLWFAYFAYSKSYYEIDDFKISKRNFDSMSSLLEEGQAMRICSVEERNCIDIYKRKE